MRHSKKLRVLTVMMAALLLVGVTAAAGENPETPDFEGGPEMASEGQEFEEEAKMEDEEREFRGGPREGEEGFGDFDPNPATYRLDLGPGAGRGGTIDKSDDEYLTALIDETAEKFSQIDYQDEESGLAFSYNLFVPEDYDENESYPLVLFITDSSLVGHETKDALTQGYGALVWAADEDQAKHPCFIVVPVYPENILEGEEGVTGYVPATLNLLTQLEGDYSIDQDRLYMTGQSMGCMTALYLNGTYPDLFAASLYVDGQWGTGILSPLKEQSFFYFAAEGDDKASEGMANVIAMFDADGASYAETVLNAKEDDETIEEGIEALLKADCSANFVYWKEGSVLPDDVDVGMGGEHMYSFDHAYKIAAVRDWLFEQEKN